MKNKTKVYAERDTIELGEHFALHMDAMTREELHGKFEIAAELAYRDKQLTEAQERVDYAKSMGMEFGTIIESNNPDGRLQHYWREGSELHRIKQEWMDLLGEDKRAEKAELRADASDSDYLDVKQENKRLLALLRECEVKFLDYAHGGYIKMPSNLMKRIQQALKGEDNGR